MNTAYKAEITLTAKTGYTFTGIAANSFTYTGATSVSNAAGSGESLTVTISFPATTAASNITVTFQTNGGSDIAGQTLASGGTATRPAANPTKTGYTFGGWYADEDLNTTFNFNTPITANTTIYAKWNPITYTVYFYINGGSMNAITCTYGVAQNLPANAFTRAGCTFLGWNTQSNGNGTAYTNGQEIINVKDTQDASLTLYAQWERGKITSTGDTAAYLSAETGGASDANPIPLILELELTEANWNAILSAINTANNTRNKFVSLDLADCTASTASSGGGLRSGGDFDPVYSSSTGKGKIVDLTLPTVATGIVAEASNNPTFKHFSALKTVSGAGVTSIGDYAFSSNSSTNSPSALTNVSFPAATAIGDSAFNNCVALASVTMAQFLPLENFNNASFPINRIVWTLAGSGSNWTTLEDGKLLIYQGNDLPGNTLVRGHAASGAITLPGTITAIGVGDFYDCDTLTSVSAPAATTIGGQAFYQCTALTSVSFPAATAIGDSAFSDCAILNSVSFPEAASIGGKAMWWAWKPAPTRFYWRGI